MYISFRTAILYLYQNFHPHDSDTDSPEPSHSYSFPKPTEKKQYSELPVQVVVQFGCWMVIFQDFSFLNSWRTRPHGASFLMVKFQSWYLWSLKKGMHFPWTIFEVSPLNHDPTLKKNYPKHFPLNRMERYFFPKDTFPPWPHGKYFPWTILKREQFFEKGRKSCFFCEIFQSLFCFLSL
jgi:hypothetical protein